MRRKLESTSVVELTDGKFVDCLAVGKVPSRRSSFHLGTDAARLERELLDHPSVCLAKRELPG